MTPHSLHGVASVIVGVLLSAGAQTLAGHDPVIRRSVDPPSPDSRRTSKGNWFG